MARVTVEDAVNKIGNRFDLIPGRSTPCTPTVSRRQRSQWLMLRTINATVVALREIEKGFITANILDQQERRDQLQQEASEMAAVAAIIGTEQ